MPVVILFEFPGVPAHAVDAGDGSRLIDICDATGADVPFSCRSASCGTCRISVVEGAELLEPADEEELAVLSIFGDDPRVCRLACQARLRRGGAGRLRVKVLAFDE